jgi:hypothetical protein
MRIKMTVVATAVVLFGSPGIAAAAPKTYCDELKGVDTGQYCLIQASDTGYNMDIRLPSSFPDQKSLQDYIPTLRDQFLNVAKSSAPREAPYSLEVTPARYSSAIPPRGTETLVLKIYQNTGGAHPETSWKTFNWDQTLRVPIVYTKPANDDKTQPLWQVDDPLKVVAPIVASELQKQTGQAVAPNYDPSNYQNFAVTNDGVIFFFNQGQLMAEAAGPLQVLVPRSAIDPMLA